MTCWHELWPIIEEIGAERSVHRIDRSRHNGVAVDQNTVDKLVSEFIQTVARAIILPRSPEDAKVGSSVFELRAEKLVCTHHWSPNLAERVVDRLSFVISPEVAADVIVVKSVLTERIERGAVRPLSRDQKGVSGEVPQTLTYVIAAPMLDDGGKVRGAWGFDTSADVGEMVLKHEMSDTVMYQAGVHISNMLGLTNPECDATI